MATQALDDVLCSANSACVTDRASAAASAAATAPLSRGTTGDDTTRNDDAEPEDSGNGVGLGGIIMVEDAAEGGAAAAAAAAKPRAEVDCIRTDGMLRVRSTLSRSYEPATSRARAAVRFSTNS